jgi:hypothetical protein
MTKLEIWITKNIQDIKTDAMGYPVLSDQQAIEIAMVLKNADVDFMYDVLHKVGDFGLFEDLLVDFAIQPTIKNSKTLAKYVKGAMVETAKYHMDEQREFIEQELKAYAKDYAEMCRAEYLIELQEVGA